MPYPKVMKLRCTTGRWSLGRQIFPLVQIPLPNKCVFHLSWRQFSKDIIFFGSGWNQKLLTAWYFLSLVDLHDVWWYIQYRKTTCNFIQSLLPFPRKTNLIVVNNAKAQSFLNRKCLCVWGGWNWRYPGYDKHFPWQRDLPCLWGSCEWMITSSSVS